MSPDEAKEWAKILGISIPSVILITGFILILLNPEKIFLWASQIQHLFSWFSSNARKGTISNKIRANILRANRIIGKIDDDILPKDLKILWTNETTPESFLSDNQIIIRMNNSSNPYKNFVTAVCGYVNSGLLTKYRNYIDSNVMRAADLSMTRKLIINSYDNALSYFDDEILNPIIEKDPELQALLDDIKTIDGNGMFIGILLKEYAKATRKIFPDQPDPCLQAETKELLRYLHSIAFGLSRTPEEMVLHSNYFNVDVFLTVRNDTLRNIGYENYIKTILNSISNDIETIYIFGLGKKIELAKQIANEVKNRSMQVNDDLKYYYYKHKSLNKGIRCQGVCIELDINNKEYN